MNWVDMLKDFDVVVSRDTFYGRIHKNVYIDGRLHDVEDGFKWMFVETLEASHTLEGMEIYRTDRELKSYALRGDISLMDKIYPVQQHPRYHVFSILELGETMNVGGYIPEGGTPELQNFSTKSLVGSICIIEDPEDGVRSVARIVEYEGLQYIQDIRDYYEIVKPISLV